MEIIRIRLDDVKPYAGNAKEHPAEQVEQIKRSISEFGNNDPIAVDEDNVIIEGHGRYMALKDLGYEEAECIRIVGLTEEQKDAYRLVHNQLTMNTGWDMEELERELRRITEVDMSAYDLAIEDIRPLDEDDVEDDVPPEPEDETDSERGDMWRLGDHVLLCGDATSAEDWEKACGGKVIDLLATDPPYNIAYGEEHGRKAIENDSMEDSRFLEFLKAAFRNASGHLKAGGAYYVWHSSKSQRQFQDALESEIGEVRQQLIWVKDHFTLGRQDYQWRHEPCFYGWKEGDGHWFAPWRNLDTVLEGGEDAIAKMSKSELRAVVEAIYGEKGDGSTIIREPKPLASAEHPTMKPVPLMARIIANSTRKGETVADPFSGSGSTLMACERLGRRCVAMEFDPRYCDVIVKRWESATGKKAEKETKKCTRK